jgi:LPXTG-motif cell wall-anchored protein
MLPRTGHERGQPLEMALLLLLAGLALRCYGRRRTG